MKNPWMSLWLSAANTWASAARGFWAGEVQRQQTAMLNEMAKEMTRFWTGNAWMVPARVPRKRTDRR